MSSRQLTTVWDSVGKRVDLRGELGSGGEGTVYTLRDDPELVAKIYHPSKLSADTRKKLELMISYPPVTKDDHTGHLFVSWPTKLLYDALGGAFRGFLMPRVNKRNNLFDYYLLKRRLEYAPSATYADLCSVARSFAVALDNLNGRSYVVGDINESNAYITDNQQATLIDADSFQVKDQQGSEVYRCLVGKPEYTPPELQGMRFADVDRNVEHDRFALGVIIYRFLMEGRHPFSGVYSGGGEKPKLEVSISKGYFSHAGGRSSVLKPEPARLPWESLPKDIRELFHKCFVEGHRDPGKRPLPREWEEVLGSAIESMRQCSRNQSHWYFGGTGGGKCVWCDRKTLLGGLDSFPPSSEPASRSSGAQTAQTARGRTYFRRSSQPAQPSRRTDGQLSRRAPLPARRAPTAREQRGLNASLLSEVISGDTEEVRSLLNADADVNVRDKGRDTPLHLASLWDYTEVVKVLLDAGADVNARRRGGDDTPLHIAAFNNNTAVARLLLDAGADVNARRRGHGDTPLHSAARMDGPEMAKVLLKAGADVNAMDKWNFTPLDYAHERRKREVANFIRRAGGTSGQSMITKSDGG